MSVPGFTAKRLRWADIDAGTIDVPAGSFRVTLGIGSGLSARRVGSATEVWAIADRGPNVGVRHAIERWGLAHLAPYLGLDGAKVMPRPDLGPCLCELDLAGDEVRVKQIIRIHDPSGAPLPGAPGSLQTGEVVLDVNGAKLDAGRMGSDTEGVAVLSDGSFWVADEYAPSLLRIDRAGRVVFRWVPDDGGAAPQGEAGQRVLPAIAARRRLNRGFEGLAVSPDERWLFVAFQSALAHPDLAAHERNRGARIWKIDAGTGAVAAQYLFPFDDPASFRRDSQAGRVDRTDLKVCELVALAEDRLLVLERISATAKVYEVRLDRGHEIPAEHLTVLTRPTLEELADADLEAAGIRPLRKRLVFSTDDAPEIDADIEGVAVLPGGELLLATDNDFGVEGAETAFWRVSIEGFPG